MAASDEPLDFWATMASTFIVFAVVGGLLLARRHLRPISSRSPWMLLISHTANFLYLGLLYQALWNYRTDWDGFQYYYTIMTIVCHYLLYFPYLLRCYRLNFVFTLDQKWGSQNDYFRRNIKRSRQSWLICVLAGFMVPVFVAALLVSYFSDSISIAPGQSPSDETRLRTEAVYILVCFLEELCFVLAVFQLRHIEDHFKMTVELTIVCSLWFINTVVSRYLTATWWLWECVGRNWALMVISSLWPVYKSFRGFGFSETITTEVANSLELLLQNQFTLDYFEKFLIRGDFSKERRDSGIMTGGAVPDHTGERLLDFWLQCEIYRNSPDIAQAQLIFDQYIDPNSKNTVDLPLQIVRDIRAGLETDSDSSLYVSAQEFVFNTLRDYYFALFQRSSDYMKMMKEIARQEIYLNRLVLTSLHGKLLYK